MSSQMLAEPYKSILNSLSEGVCAVDATFRVGCFNLQAERLTGMGTRLRDGLATLDQWAQGEAEGEME